MNRRSFLQALAAGAGVAALGAAGLAAAQPVREVSEAVHVPTYGPRIHGIRERRHQPFWDTLVRHRGAPPLLYGARTDDETIISYSALGAPHIQVLHRRL